MRHSFSFIYKHSILISTDLSILFILSAPYALIIHKYVTENKLNCRCKHTLISWDGCVNRLYENRDQSQSSETDHNFILRNLVNDHNHKVGPPTIVYHLSYIDWLKCTVAVGKEN